MHKIERVETYPYHFGGYTVIAKKYVSHARWAWVLLCDTCGQTLPIRKLGSEYWVARCSTCAAEFTLTPGSVYKETETKLDLVM